MTEIPSPANPPERLLCGPGPCNVSPAALAALQKPLLGHMDPDFADSPIPQLDHQLIIPTPGIAGVRNTDGQEQSDLILLADGARTAL